MGIKQIKTKIRTALKNQGSYSKGLESCIDMVASAYYAMALAQHDLSECNTTYVEQSCRDGSTRLTMHPAFRVLKDSMEALRRGLRELKLTLATIEVTDDDEITELIDKVNSIEVKDD